MRRLRDDDDDDDDGDDGDRRKAYFSLKILRRVTAVLAREDHVIRLN